jgi:putative transposase
VLLRLAYLGVTNALAILRLLPMSDRDKDAEILALRHQIMVLQRQLGNERVQSDPTDRAFLAALLHRLPIDVLHNAPVIGSARSCHSVHTDRCSRHAPKFDACSADK